MTWLVILLVGLTLDATGTWQCCQREAQFYEANPVVRWFMARWGSLGGILVRALVLGWVALCWRIWGAYVGQNVAITLGVIFAIAGVLAWNRARRWIG